MKGHTDKNNNLKLQRSESVESVQPISGRNIPTKHMVLEAFKQLAPQDQVLSFIRIKNYLTTNYDIDLQHRLPHLKNAIKQLVYDRVLYQRGYGTVRYVHNFTGSFVLRPSVLKEYQQTQKSGKSSTEHVTTKRAVVKRKASSEIVSTKQKKKKSNTEREATADDDENKTTENEGNGENSSHSELEDVSSAVDVPAVAKPKKSRRKRKNSDEEDQQKENLQDAEETMESERSKNVAEFVKELINDKNTFSMSESSDVEDNNSALPETPKLSGLEAPKRKVFGRKETENLVV